MSRTTTWMAVMLAHRTLSAPISCSAFCGAVELPRTMSCTGRRIERLHDSGFDRTKQHADGASTHLAGGLSDGCEAWVGEARKRNIVEACNGHVIRHMQLVRTKRIHNDERLRIVVAQQGVGTSISHSSGKSLR